MKWKQEDTTGSAVAHQPPVFSPVSTAGQEDREPAPAGRSRAFGLWLPFILGGLALAVVIVLMLAVTGRRQETVELARVERLEARLDQIQADIARIDAALDKFAAIETRVADLDRSQTEMGDRLGRLATEAARLRRAGAALRKKATVPVKPARPAKAAGKSGKTVYHRVRRGDTLYAIGRRYGTTVKRLRRDNHLGPKEKLHPGRVLVIRVP